MIEKVIQKHLDSHTFPGIVLSIERAGKTFLTLVSGFAQVEPEKVNMSKDTYFDMASVTKPLATTTAFLALCEAESIDLRKPAGSFIPELNSQTAGLSLTSLMTHTSGLPPIPEIYRLFDSGADIDLDRSLKHLYSLTPEQPPGTGVLYSCTGYILLTRILERISGHKLSEVFQELVSGACGIEHLVFNPPESLRNQCAATEFDPWRGRLIRGEVHDENSFCFKGEGGNAGLFGTVSAVSEFLDLFLSEGVLRGKQILSPESVRNMTTCQTPGFSPRRAWGFLTQDKDSLAGPGFSEGAFGHSGFTGTSVWVDPELQLKVVTLTNRVHFGRDNTAEKIKLFRRELHQAILYSL